MNFRNPADLCPEDLAEIRPAVRDVAFELTHDLSDTRQNLRDAAAFAPIALMKTLGWIAGYLAARPRRTLMGAGAVLLAVGLLGITRRGPRPR